MDPMTIGALAGGGLGLLKSFTVDADKEKRDRALQAAIAKYSPWTGMKPNTNIPEANAFNAALQGGMGGAAQGQNFSAAQDYNDMIRNKSRYYGGKADQMDENDLYNSFG